MLAPPPSWPCFSLGSLATAAAVAAELPAANRLFILQEKNSTSLGQLLRFA